jgi:hypothetical protein
VTYAVFGTAKPWRQYHGLVVNGCGIRKIILRRRQQRDEEAIRSQGLEFERLPSLHTSPSEEQRAKGKEPENRVRMFVKEEPKMDSSSSTEDTSRGPVASPSVSRQNSSSTRHIQFHKPPPSVSNTTKCSLRSGVIEVGLSVDPKHQVIQNGYRHERIEDEFHTSRALTQPKRSVNQPSPEHEDFLFDSSN